MSNEMNSTSKVEESLKKSIKAGVIAFTDEMSHDKLVKFSLKICEEAREYLQEINSSQDGIIDEIFQSCRKYCSDRIYEESLLSKLRDKAQKLDQEKDIHEIPEEFPDIYVEVNSLTSLLFLIDTISSYYDDPQHRFYDEYAYEVYEHVNWVKATRGLQEAFDAKVRLTIEDLIAE